MKSVSVPMQFFDAWIGGSQFTSKSNGTFHGYNSDETLQGLNYNEKLHEVNSKDVNLLSDVRYPFSTFETQYLKVEGSQTLNEGYITIPPLKIRTLKLTK